MLARELPALHGVLSALRIEPSSYFLPWAHSLFVGAFSLDVASRLWDCYLRDGEVLLWRAALELLRARAARVAAEVGAGAERALACLLAPASNAELSEKLLFGAVQEHEDEVMLWLPLLGQKLPLPDACWDLQQNSYEWERAHAGASGGGGADGIAESMSMASFEEESARAAAAAEKPRSSHSLGSSLRLGGLFSTFGLGKPSRKTDPEVPPSPRKPPGASRS